MSATPTVCRETRAALPLDERSGAVQHVKSHLATCVECRAIADELGAMFAARREYVEEPLSPITEERTLARLRPLLTPRESRWAPWALASVSAMAAAVALVIVLRWPPQHEPPLRLAASVGHVTTSVPVLDVGASFSTVARGRALVDLPRSRVAALADTAVRVDAATVEDVRLSVERGALVADVDPNQARPRRFAVHLPHAEVLVTGTRFFVAASGDHDQVAVERGHVRVRVGDQTLALAAGDLVDIDSTGTAHRRRLDAGENARLNAALRVDRWGEDDVEALSRGFAANAGVAPAPVVVPLPPVVLEPATPQKRSKVTVTEEKKVTVTDIRAALEERDCDRASALAAPLKVGGDEASRVWFALAQCYHAAERRSEAAAAYSEVVRRFPKAVVSENAAYEVARLSRELGRNRVAESAFIDYLAKYPKGALAEEATFWRCHLAAANDHPDDAITCLRGFRARFTASQRVTDTYLLEATLQRTTKNDCGAAITAYRAYLDRGGANREQAERWKAWCEGQR